MVTIENITPWDTLQKQIRHVPLLHPVDGKEVFPYRDAEISIKDIDLTQVRPTTLYVLREGLSVQDKLAADLSDHNLDPLQLDCSLQLKDPSGESFGLLPPIIEESDEDGPYLLDGAHRAVRARSLGINVVRAVHITGIDPNYPIFIDPNNWDEIVTYDTVPSDPTLKKRFRISDPYTMYRNFGVLGCGSPRKANGTK